MSHDPDQTSSTRKVSYTIWPVASSGDLQIWTTRLSRFSSCIMNDGVSSATYAALWHIIVFYLLLAPRKTVAAKVCKYSHRYRPFAMSNDAWELSQKLSTRDIIWRMISHGKRKYYKYARALIIKMMTNIC